MPGIVVNKQVFAGILFVKISKKIPALNRKRVDP